jgi:hypothetical protein
MQKVAAMAASTAFPPFQLVRARRAPKAAGRTGFEYVNADVGTEYILCSNRAIASLTDQQTAVQPTANPTFMRWAGLPPMPTLGSGDVQR